jgi:hypothetical protein
MRFEPGVPFRSREPTVTVDPGLEEGPHRFQLVVVNARGQRSQPAVVTVTIVRRPRIPTPFPVFEPTPRPLDPDRIIRPPIR